MRRTFTAGPLAATWPASCGGEDGRDTNADPRQSAGHCCRRRGAAASSDRSSPVNDRASLRLLRICAYYGNTRLQFVCCSATLANPEFHFRQLVPLISAQQRLCVVQADTSPKGERLFALWNPVWRSAGEGNVVL